MINFQRERNPQPTPPAEERKHSFGEVHTDYTPEQAVAEAMRCLNCREHPCMNGCPAKMRIPEFIALVARGDFDGAWEIVRSRSLMPAICGRVCPQERQCEGNCTRAKRGETVGIGALERFVADWHFDRYGGPREREKAETGRSVAVVGAGPAGLACAEALAAKGRSVTVYDYMARPGGVLTYGIPEFRMPRVIVSDMVENLKKAGVRFVTKTAVGLDITIDELFASGFDAVFLGIGAVTPNRLDIPGIRSRGVITAYDYLAHINAIVEGLARGDARVAGAKRVIVIGAGNVSMDAARSAVRMGAESVTIVHRRGMADSTACAEELKQAVQEGVIYSEYTAPAAVLTGEDGRVTGLECLKTAAGEPDESGRRAPIMLEGTNFTLPADLIILAVGAKPEGRVFGEDKEKMMTPRGVIAADETFATPRAGVFAAGDAVTGAATVVKAMSGGRTAAESIDRYLESLG
ncbi:MAG: NAD(P)-dependent oxidoreductase [Oscillospiraceae bacterium]|nr:NAD(P)-dependent oxidoreductase [Oscillospiraceae bacterium]